MTTEAQRQQALGTLAQLVSKDAPSVGTETQPTVTVSMSRKINLGNYESADAFVSISGVRAGMTEVDLAPLLETGKVAWEMVRAALVEKVAKMREGS